MKYLLIFGGFFLQALGNLDEDGFFMGECNGNQGLVPKNMVEHITDPKELANITEKLTMLLKKQKGKHPYLPTAYPLCLPCVHYAYNVSIRYK